MIKDKEIETTTVHPEAKKQALPLYTSFITIILTVLIIACAAWFNFAGQSLLWTFEQTGAVTFSGVAVLFATAILVGLKIIGRLSPGLKSEKRQILEIGFVYRPLGVALLFLAFALSYIRNEWHIHRVVYFSLATLGSAISLATCFVELKRSKGKIELWNVLCWLVMLATFLWRFAFGSPTDGLFLG